MTIPRNSVDDRIKHARLIYERAVFRGDLDALQAAEPGLDAVEADLALARGLVLHAQFLDRQREAPSELALFEQARHLYRKIDDARGEGEASFWIGCFHQVVRRDNDAAIPVLERSYELATEAGDALTQSYALRHLGIADHAAGRLDSARQRLEESVRLRTELGFSPGVAANLVGLAYVAVAQDRRDDAQALLADAHAIAKACGAERIMDQAEEAQASIGER